MDNTTVSTLVNFIGVIVGTGGGILVSSRLTNYRLEQLEKKVDKHNSVIERTFILETQVKECISDIKDLERK